MTILHAMVACACLIGFQGAGDTTPARELYTRAAEALRHDNASSATANLETLIELYPEHELSPLAAAKLGDLYWKQNDFEHTAQLLAAWMERIDSSAVVLKMSPKSPRQAHLQLAMASEKVGDSDRALRHYELLHRESEGSTQAWLATKLVGLYLEKHDTDSAKSLMLLEKKEGLSELELAQHQLDQAKLFLQRKFTSEAKSLLLAIQTDSISSTDRSRIEFLVSDTWIACHEHARAAELLDSLIGRMNDKYPTPLFAAATLRRCEVALLEKDWERASELAQDILHKAPELETRQEFYLILGRVAIAQVDFASARNQFDTAIQMKTSRPSDAASRAAWFIGETYFLANDYEAAITSYTRVVQEFPASDWTAAALVQRGKCKELRQDREGAIEDYQAIVDRFSSSAWFPWAANRLREIQSASASVPTNSSSTRR